jgi:hypothetical protein
MHVHLWLFTSCMHYFILNGIISGFISDMVKLYEDSCVCHITDWCHHTARKTDRQTASQNTYNLSQPILLMRYLFLFLWLTCTDTFHSQLFFFLLFLVLFIHLRILLTLLTGLQRASILVFRGLKNIVENQSEIHFSHCWLLSNCCTPSPVHRVHTCSIQIIALQHITVSDTVLVRHIPHSHLMLCFDYLFQQVFPILIFLVVMKSALLLMSRAFINELLDIRDFCIVIQIKYINSKIRYLQLFGITGTIL